MANKKEKEIKDYIEKITTQYLIKGDNVITTKRGCLKYTVDIDWKIDISKIDKNHLGICYIFFHRIAINSEYVKIATIEEIKNVISHEVAHAITYHYNKEEKNHSPVWKRIDKALGGDAQAKTYL